MAWHHQATNNYLSQCWPRSMSPYDITWPHELNHNSSNNCNFQIVCRCNTWISAIFIGYVCTVGQALFTMLCCRQVEISMHVKDCVTWWIHKSKSSWNLDVLEKSYLSVCKKTFGDEFFLRHWNIYITDYKWILKEIHFVWFETPLMQIVSLSQFTRASHWLATRRHGA